MSVNTQGTITVRILAQDLASGNVSKFIGSLDKAAKQSGLLGWAVKGTAASMGAMLNPAALVAKGIGAVVDVLGDSIKAFNDDALSQKQLQTSLEANIEGWNGNTKAIEALIASRTRLGFSDDQQRENLALIVAQVEDVNDALAIQRTAMDLARLKSISLADASNVLAKAYLGSTTGLQKMGIKLAKGTDGMEAIAAVQQRAAGQAKAYSETMVGATEVMAIGFDEFKESVGGALTGALTPFFNLVVDLTNQAPDLDTSLGKLTQQYRDMIQVKADAIQQDAGWDDEVTGLLQGVFMPQDKAIHDFTGTLGEYQVALGVSRKDLALFTEAGLTAGQSLDQIRGTLDMLMKQHVEEKAKSIGHAWQTGMTEVSSASKQAGEDIYGGLVKPVRHAFRAMFATMDSQKEPWKSAWKDMAKFAKDPFRPKAFEDWLGKRAEKAAEKAAQAAKNNQPKAARYWQAFADVMSNPVLAALATTEEEIQKLVEAAATINDVTSTLGSYSRNGSSGRHSKGHWKTVTKKNGDTQMVWVPPRAMGGFAEAGRTYDVGERGRERLRMLPGGGAVVTPVAGGGGSGEQHVHFHFHGVAVAPSEAQMQQYARAVTPAIRRELARAGG